LSATARLLYVWGRWVWYYRALALVVYATGVLIILGFAAPVSDYLRNPTPVNVLLLFLVIVLAAMWCLWAWVTWRTGQSRANRIYLDLEAKELVMTTLNFGKRSIPLAALRRAEFTPTQTYVNPHGIGSTRYYEPTLTVPVEDGLPIRIDLQGRIVDEEAFKELFGFDPQNPNTRLRRKRFRR
jgi:hypothetical protein